MPSRIKIETALCVLFFLITFGAIQPVKLGAAQPWAKNPSEWSAKDIQQLLAGSPWTQQASASFLNGNQTQAPVPAPLPGAGTAGLAGGDGASHIRWDGGVGRNDRGGLPSLDVTVRWDSAFPIRQALLRSQTPISATERAQSEYIVTVIGLVPAGAYKAGASPDTQSRSDASVDVRNPENMLESLMTQSRLIPGGKQPIAAEDVKLDASTGAVHLFFPRSQPISLHEKEVTLVTRFGSMLIEKRFRLKEMVYKGKLEL